MKTKKDYKAAYLVRLKRIKIIKYVVFSTIMLVLVLSLIWHNELTKLVNPNYYKASELTYYNGQGALTETGLKVHYIDVGCADCTFIELPDNKCALIDCAGDILDKDKSVQAMMLYLNNNIFNNREKVIDYLIITHADADHVFGVNEILHNYKINNIVRPKVLSKGEKQKISEKQEYSYALNYKIDNNPIYEDVINGVYDYLDNNIETKMYFSYQGLSFSTLDYVLEFLTPEKDVYTEDNDYSCAIKLSYKEQNFLFMADCTTLGESEILDYYASFDIEKLVSKFLKVGHHGSDTSSGYAFLNAAKAEYYIESTRVGVYSNIPSSEVEKRINNSCANAKILRTDNNGNIVIYVDTLGNYALYTSEGSFYFVKHNVFIYWYYYAICVGVLCFILIFSIKLKSYEQLMQQKKNKIEKKKQKLLKAVEGDK